jgi:rhodanese-related sulfurtransferase
MAVGNGENYVMGVKKLKSRLSHLEQQVEMLSAKLDHFQNLEKTHMLRIKNGEELSDDFIIKGSCYYDLSPEKAYEIYNNNDKDFILLDVSKDDYKPIADFPEVTKISMEELTNRIHELPNKTTSIMVISENGLRSIQSCHLLYEMGYYNINNISGGYKYWPGFNNLKSLQASHLSA